jgi:hypothetical protein
MVETSAEASTSQPAARETVPAPIDGQQSDGRALAAREGCSPEHQAAAGGRRLSAGGAPFARLTPEFLLWYALAHAAEGALALRAKAAHWQWQPAVGNWRLLGLGLLAYGIGLGIGLLIRAQML